MHDHVEQSRPRHERTRQRCGSMGIGPHQGLGSPLNTGAKFYPTVLPSQVAYWDFRVFQAIDLGATLLASGPGTPPDLLLGGSMTGIVCPRLEITPDSTHFRWTRNNTGTGALNNEWDEQNVAIPFGTDYALPGTGLTVSFPLSAFTSGQVYQGTIRNCRSRVSGADPLNQDTASRQPRYIIETSTGNPVAKSDGVDDYLVCTTIDRPAPGTSTPTFIYGIGKIITWGAFKALTGGGDASSYTLAIACRGTSPSLSLNTQAATDTGGSTVLSSFKRFMAYFKNSSAGHSGSDPAAWGDYLQWGAIVGGAGSAGSTNPPAGFSLFSDNGRASTFLAAEVGAIGLTSAIPNAANLALLDGYFVELWGSGVTA